VPAFLKGTRPKKFPWGSSETQYINILNVLSLKKKIIYSGFSPTVQRGVNIDFDLPGANSMPYSMKKHEKNPHI
jgi:hypothetical protein